MLTFGSASMLWVSLAAVIPLILHIWNRKPREIVPFAATRFLIAATRRQSRRLRFQEWFLLALRVAMLLLLAFALADPRWRSAAASPMQAEIPTHHLLVVDDSYSMAAKIGDRTRLQLAQERLIELVRAAPSGDLFSLVTMGDPAEVIIAGPSHDRDEIEKAIREIAPRPISLRPSAARVLPALSLLRRLIEEDFSSEHPHAHRVTIASDLQRSTWGEISPEQIDETLGVASTGATWTLLIPSDAPPQTNLAILQFTAASPVAYEGRPIEGEVVIANAGARAIENALLEIRAGEQILFRDEITLAPGQQQSRPWRIAPQHAPLQLAALKLEARLAEDDLETDNRRKLAIEVRPKPRILCIASSQEAARHVVTALTTGAPETRPAVDLLLAAPWPKLADYDAVLLLNLPTIPEDLAAPLKSFAEQGGGILIGLGDRAMPNSAPNDLFPASLGPVIAQDMPQLDPLEYVHPLVAAFRDAPEVGLLTLPLWRYRKLQSLAPNAKIAAKFANGDPALIEAPLGRGKIVLFAGSLGAESLDHSATPAAPWSGLPGSAAYVPLLHEWTMRCATPDFAAPQNADFDASESWFQSDRPRWASFIDAKPSAASSAAAPTSRTADRSLAAWLLIPVALLAAVEIAIATLLRRGKSPSKALVGQGAMR